MLAGERLDVGPHHVRQGVQLGEQRRLVRIIGNVDQRLAGRNHGALRGEVRQVAQRLHRLHGDDEVGLPERDQVAADAVRAQAHVALDVAAAPAHAVHFGLLEMQPGGRGGLADHGRDGEDPLPSDTGKFDIEFHFVSCFF